MNNNILELSELLKEKPMCNESKANKQTIKQAPENGIKHYEIINI